MFGSGMGVEVEVKGEATESREVMVASCLNILKKIQISVNG